MNRLKNDKLPVITKDRPLSLPSTAWDSRNDSFTLYFVYKPAVPNAIFVPLQQVEWWWGKTATYIPSQMGPQFGGRWEGDGGYANHSDWNPSTEEPQWQHLANKSELIPPNN